MVDQSYSLLNYWYVKIKGTTYLKTKHHFNYTTVCSYTKKMDYFFSIGAIPYEF